MGDTMTEEGGSPTQLLDRARSDLLQLHAVGGMTPDKLCAILAPRYPRTVLEVLFPGVAFPSVTEVGPKRGELLSRRSSRVEPQGGLTALQVPALVRSTELQPRAPAPPALSPSIARSLQVEEPPVELAFQYVPLIQCTFPHSEQPGLTTYTRRNGRLEVTIATSVADRGLPYGIPARLLTIFVATEVVRLRSREIFLGRTVTEFLKRLGVTPTSGRRGTIGSYQDQLQRLVHTVFTIEEKIEDGAGRRGIDIAKRLFAERAQLWDDGEASLLYLSEPLYESMLERSAPLSLDAIRQLRKSPLDLDLYSWLVYRLFHLRRAVTIPWPEIALQFGQSYDKQRFFRSAFSLSLKRVLRVYPEARVLASLDGVRISPSRHHIQRSR